MHGELTLAKKNTKAAAGKLATYGRMVQFLRDVERKAPHGGTGATIIKLARNPIAQLLYESEQRERGVKGAKKHVDGEKFGGHELQAAQEIETAFFAISGGLMFKPLLLERIDRARAPDLSPQVAMKVKRYQAWACHWSMLAKQCDPTLEIVISAVIDQRGLREIAADLGFGHERIRNAVVRGLRDYAARAGWVGPREAAMWKVKAAHSFRRLTPLTFRDSRA